MNTPIIWKHQIKTCRPPSGILLTQVLKEIFMQSLMWTGDQISLLTRPLLNSLLIIPFPSCLGKVPLLLVEQLRPSPFSRALRTLPSKGQALRTFIREKKSPPSWNRSLVITNPTTKPGKIQEGEHQAWWRKKPRIVKIIDAGQVMPEHGGRSSG